MKEQQLDTLSCAIDWYNMCVNIPFDSSGVHENVARHLHARMWSSWLNKMQVPHAFNEESLLPIYQRVSSAPSIIVPKFNFEYLDDTTIYSETNEIPLFLYFETMCYAHDIAMHDEINTKGYAILEKPSLPYRLEGISWNPIELAGCSGILKIPEYKDSCFRFPRDICYANKHFLAGLELTNMSWREQFRKNVYGSLFLLNEFEVGQKQECVGGGSMRLGLGIDKANEVLIAFYKKYNNVFIPNVCL